MYTFWAPWHPRGPLCYDLVIPKSHCKRDLSHGHSSDGHHEGICLSAIAGEVDKFSLCVRYYPVLHGTCSSLGKTLDICLSFFMVIFCLASLKSFSDFAPRVWPGCVSHGVCRGKSRESSSRCNQVCFLRGLLAPSRISKQSSDHSLPQFFHLHLNFPIYKREIMRHNDSLSKADIKSA